MIRFLLLAIPILTITACSRHQGSPSASRAQSTTAAVQIETVNVSSIPKIYRASGTVRARQTAAIASRIAASILNVRVGAGDHVQSGQTLIVLDQRDLEAALRRAEATR